MRLFCKYLYSILVFCLLLSSCSSVKYVPEDKYLLNKISIDVDNKSIKSRDLEPFLRQEPNTKILWMARFHLGLYNLSSKKRENSWLKRIGEAPVVYDPFYTDRSKQELIKHLANKGYYHAEISDSTIYIDKKRKAEVQFKIKTGEPHIIENLNVDIQDTNLAILDPIIRVRKDIQSGKIFDVSNLDNTRKDLVNIAKNNGYFDFNSKSIYCTADTTIGNNKVDLTMVVTPKTIVGNDSIVQISPHEKFKVRRYIIYSNYSIKKSLFEHKKERFDTIKVGNYYFLQEGDMIFRPELIISANHIDDNRFYELDDVKKTYNQLSQLRIFKVINIQFVSVDKLDREGYPMLDCVIQLTPSSRQSYSVDLEGTNTSGNLGVGTTLSYQNKNLFKGGELLDVSFLGSIENQRYGIDNESFNTIEGGVDVTLTIPKFWFPIRANKWFKYSTPQTQFLVSYNYQKRPDYTRTIVRGGFGYQWKSRSHLSHSLNILDFNMVQMVDIDDKFFNSIKNLTIRSSYTDHTIAALSYSMVLNTQTNSKNNYVYLRVNFESSGNFLHGINSLFNFNKSVFDSLTGPQYAIFNTPYAQYVKIDADFRKAWVLDKYNTMVFRGFVGAAVPYGNSDQMPFERKYYTGGANGLRGWGVRELGPGSYIGNPNDFPNQTGDIKIETNLEYRFKMIQFLNGALFVDAGNIWSLKDNREGAEFDWGRFYNEFAINTGVGVRLDFDYAVIRTDLGMKLKTPYKEASTGKRWILGNRKMGWDDFEFSIAIGYPF